MLFSSRGWGSRICLDEPDLRTACPAGVWLGVESSIQRVVVFGLTLGTHREHRHRGLRAVIGNAACDGKARSAICAVEKRIAITAVGWIEKFPEAVVTGCGIRRDAGANATKDFACDDAKTDLGRRRDLFGHDRVDAGQGRSLGSEPLEKNFDAGPAPFELYDDAVSIVADEPGELLFCGEAKHERAKTDTLNHTAHPDTFADSVPFGAWRSG